MMRITLFILSLLLIGACEAEPQSRADVTDARDSAPEVTPTTCEPTATSVLEDIFQVSCGVSRCHASERPWLGLDLETRGVEYRLNGQPSRADGCEDQLLVTAGDPEASVLYQKIIGTHSCGDRMPSNQPPLDDAATACIRDWITDLDPCETCGGETCLDLSRDPDNCGACGAVCATGVCSGGACACDGGLTLCGDACVNTWTDAAHCGACGVACPAGSSCVDGACACPEDQQACDGSCVDLQSDLDNCGACAQSCTGSEVCNMGVCSADCGDLTNCSSSCVDLQSDRDHCGACGAVCPLDQSCSGGTCACPEGLTLCEGRCVDTSSDAAHCGVCGAACSLGERCSEGACGCVEGLSFASDIQPIFTGSCASNACHGGRRPSENLDLTEGQAYGALVNVPSSQCRTRRLRVAPGSVPESYLVNKLTGVDMCSGGNIMPKSGEPLPAEELQKIAAWICDGAPDN